LIDGGGAFGGFPGHEEARGSDPGEETVSPYLWSRGFRKIDVVALTHAHQDHLGGLNAILGNFHVDRLWIGREVNNNAALTRLEALARERNIPVEYEARGNYFSLDEVQGGVFVAGIFERQCLSRGEEQRFAGIEIEIPKQNVTASW
jgi:competence protein ComEC